MKRLTLLLLLALLPIAGFAQNRQSYSADGTVRDAKTNNPIGYPTVSLTDTLGAIRNAVAAGPDGKFVISYKTKGTFLLRVSMLGYRPDTLRIILDNDKLHLGNILLTADEMKEVTVTATVPLVQVDDEKLTYNLEQDPETPTSQLADIIRKIPQLSIDADGNVLLNGQSNYKILLNGRNSAQMSRNFKEIIESMPASAIKNIEVITNPSMKYESEGAGGIINIITNRGATINGYNGNVGASLHVSENMNYSGNGYLAFQRGKVSTSITGTIFGISALRDNISKLGGEIFASDSMHYVSNSSSTAYGGVYSNLNVNVSYEIDTLDLLTFELGGNLTKWRMKSHSNAMYKSVAMDTTRYYDQYTKSVNPNQGLNGSVNFQHTFNRDRHTLTLSFDFDYNPEHSTSNEWYDNTIGFVGYRADSYSKSSQYENTVQIDYVNPITKKHNIEAGVRYSFRRSNSESYKNRLLDGVTDWTADPYSPKTNIDYDRHILGIYAGYSLTLKRFSARAGARYEESWNDISILNGDGTTSAYTPRFPSLVPYASLNYRPNDMHTLSLSYTQRVHRPNIYNMNPFVERTEMTASYGNPHLKTAIHHSIAASYGLNTSHWNASLRANAQFSGNTISNYTTASASGIITTTYGNIVDNQNYSTSIYAGYRLGTKFNISLNAEISYEVFDAPKISQHTEGWEYSLSSYMNVELWKDAQLFANYGFYKGGVGLGFRSSKSTSYYGFGLTQRLINKKLTLSLNANNPFPWWHSYEFKAETPDYKGSGYSRYAIGSVSFSISYRFGKHDVYVKSTERSITSDDIETSKSSGAAGGANTGM